MISSLKKKKHQTTPPPQKKIEEEKKTDRTEGWTWVELGEGVEDEYDQDTLYKGLQI